MFHSIGRENNDTKSKLLIAVFKIYLNLLLKDVSQHKKLVQMEKHVKKNTGFVTVKTIVQMGPTNIVVVR